MYRSKQEQLELNFSGQQVRAAYSGGMGGWVKVSPAYPARGRTLVASAQTDS